MLSSFNHVPNIIDVIRSNNKLTVQIILPNVTQKRFSVRTGIRMQMITEYEL